MTTKADALLKAVEPIINGARDPHEKPREVLRALIQELGITREMVAGMLRYSSLNPSVRQAADALETILEAGGE